MADLQPKDLVLDASPAPTDVFIFQDATTNEVKRTTTDDIKTALVGSMFDYLSFDFVNSGCVLSGDNYGVSRNGSMTSGIIVIAGVPLTVSTVTARSYTASKDTYVDASDNGDGTALLTYTEVTNNNASPALAAGSMRLGIVVTDATTIATAGSVNQGQEDKVLPIASSIPYAVTDSLGNLICPRDPSRRILSSRNITATVTINAVTETDVTGLSAVVIADGKRKISLSAKLHATSAGGVGAMQVRIKEGATNICISAAYVGNTVNAFMASVEKSFTPTAGTHTYKVSIVLPSTTSNAYADTSGFESFIKARLD